MKEIAVVIGLLLTGLGLYGYLNPVQDKGAEGEQAVQPADADPKDGDGKEAKVESKYGSKTALIPALFGIPILMCGTLAYMENLRMHAMHAAAAIALIGGLLAGGRGATKVGALFGDDPVSQRAATMVIIMAFLCFSYVVLSIRSFRAARKAREMGEVAA